MSARASIRIKVARLLFAALVTAGMSSPALAEFLSGYTGHTVFGLGDPRGDGHVSFAVYENLGGANWIGSLGLAGGTVQPLKAGNPVIDNAAYVYFYQIVNTDPLPAGSGPDRALTGMVLRDAADWVTSVGYLAGTVFNDHETEGGVNGTNVNLGDNTWIADTTDDGAPSASGFQFAGAPFLADSGAQRPDNYHLDYTDLRFRFRNLTEFGLGDFSIDPDGCSTVVFITSDAPPAYQFGILEDSADTQADLPSPAPEPVPIATLVLVGLPLAVLWTRRSRRGGQA